MPKNSSKKGGLKAKLKSDPFVWVIAYIDKKFLKNTEKDLNRYPEYAGVEAYIPTVKILKKTFKNENFFEEVPLLFNYGFFKVPRKYAVYKNWLENMQKNITCIYGWVKDPANVISSRPKIRDDEKSVFRGISVATATSAEIAKLIRDSVNIGAHSADDISLLKTGDPIILRGYPWEGIRANVLEIDHKKQDVKVELQIFSQMKEVRVSFDNVFFTIYHHGNYDDSLTQDKSFDEMADNKSLDRFQKKNMKNDTE
jgi:transcription antitermination factor NusG